MAVKLNLVKYPPDVAPEQLSASFGAEGGIIGRGRDTDWVLADPRRFLSSKHCKITEDAGRYVLTDLSTNGTYVNGAASPLGRGTQTALNDGDLIELGDYQIKVAIVASEFAYPKLPFDDATPLPDRAFQAEPAFAAFSSSDSSAPFADIIPGALSTTDPLQALGVGTDSSFAASAGAPVHAEANALSRSDPLSEAFDWPAVHTSKGALPEDWGDDISILGPQTGIPASYNLADEDALIAKTPAPAAKVQTAQRPALSAGKSPPAPAKPARRTSNNSGDALLQALGLEDAQLSDEQVEELQATVGLMVRESLGGLMQVLRSRASIKNEFRMAVTTIQPVENNPIKFSASVDDALQTMFVRRSQAYKPPVEAVADSFDAIADHQIAVIAGIRAAFRGLLAKFDPNLLEETFRQTGKVSLMRGIGKGKYWSAYEAHYQQTVDNMERSFQELFGDDFVQAYEDQLGKLARARKQNKNS